MSKILAKKLYQTENVLIVLFKVLLILSLKSLPVFANDLNSKQTIEQTMETNKSSIPWRQIKFISPQQSLGQSQWRSAIPVFSGKGMDHLYLITQYIIDSLQPPGLPPNVIKEELFDDPIPVLNENKGRVSVLKKNFITILLIYLSIIDISVNNTFLGINNDFNSYIKYCYSYAINWIRLLLLLFFRQTVQTCQT